LQPSEINAYYIYAARLYCLYKLYFYKKSATFDPSFINHWNLLRKTIKSKSVAKLPPRLSHIYYNGKNAKQ